MIYPLVNCLRVTIKLLYDLVIDINERIYWIIKRRKKFSLLDLKSSYTEYVCIYWFCISLWICDTDFIYCKLIHQVRFLIGDNNNNKNNYYYLRLSNDRKISDLRKLFYYNYCLNIKFIKTSRTNFQTPIIILNKKVQKKI